jgi:hypothetical protein
MHHPDVWAYEMLGRIVHCALEDYRILTLRKRAGCDLYGVNQQALKSAEEFLFDEGGLELLLALNRIECLDIDAVRDMARRSVL